MNTAKNVQFFTVVQNSLCELKNVQFFVYLTPCSNTAENVHFFTVVQDSLSVCAVSFTVVKHSLCFVVKSEWGLHRA